MARIFTIDFEFRGRTHTAMVATWKEEAPWDYFQIALQDEALQHLVPDGIVRFSTADAEALTSGTARDELVQCLKKTVAHYLKNVLPKSSSVAPKAEFFNKSHFIHKITCMKKGYL